MQKNDDWRKLVSGAAAVKNHAASAMFDICVKLRQFILPPMTDAYEQLKLGSEFIGQRESFVYWDQMLIALPRPGPNWKSYAVHLYCLPMLDPLR